MRPTARSLARVLVPVTVLGVVVVETGPAPFVAGVRALDPTTLLLGLLLGVPATLASAWRWRVVATALGTPVAPATAVAAVYAAQVLNTTLPAGVAGDVYRGLRHAPVGERLRGLRAVAWERAGGQAVQAVVALAVLLLLLPSLVPRLTWLVAGVATAAFVLRALRRRLLTAWPWLHDDLRRLRAAGVLPRVVAASLLAQGCFVATGLLAARAVGVDAAGTTLVPLLLVMLVAMALPLNLAGWGPREGAAAWCFAAAGLGAHAGVATAVAYGVLVAVAALPGTVVLLLRSDVPRPLDRVPEEVGRG